MHVAFTNSRLKLRSRTFTIVNVNNFVETYKKLEIAKKIQSAEQNNISNIQNKTAFIKYYYSLINTIRAHREVISKRK